MKINLHKHLMIKFCSSLSMLNIETFIMTEEKLDQLPPFFTKQNDLRLSLNPSCNS